MTVDAANRNLLTRLLQDALEALERGDEATWRERIETLSDSKTRNVVKRLGRLARELEQALETLPPSPAEGGLGDACARLDHVVEMTEQATHRTLDLIDDSRALLAQLQDEALAPAQATIVEGLRTHLKDMALTQSHQDLGGQIIRRVAGIVRHVHENLGALDLSSPDGGTDSARGHGPAVSGLDRDTVDQRDADDLLSHLGL
ncbi:protein phosphatase CheZ [Luteimonas sp. A478]